MIEIPASDANLVIGSGGSATITVGGTSLGCITGAMTLNRSRQINDYQTLCSVATELQQGTPGSLSITGTVTVEFIVGNAGIAAAEDAIESAALVPVVVTYKGQGVPGTPGATDVATMQCYLTALNKTVSPGAGSGTVQVDFRAISIA